MVREWLRTVRLASWAGPLGIRPWQVATSLLLALAVAVFDGAGLGLLVPIAQGVVSGEFTGAAELPVVGRLAEWTLRTFTGAAGTAGFGESLVALATLAFVVAAIRSALAYGAFLFGAHWYGAYERRAYVYALERYLGFGKRYFDNANRGASQAVLGFIGDLIDSLKLIQLTVLDVLTLTAYLAVMLWISPRLTLFVLIALPVVHAAVRLAVRRIRATSEAMNEATLRDHALTQNILSSVPLLKTFGAEGRVRDQFAASRERLRRISFRINATQGLITPVQELIVLLVLLTLIGVAASMTGDDGAGFASFLVFFYVVRTAVPRLTALQDRLTTLAMRAPRLAELGRLHDDTDKDIVPDGRDPFPGLEQAIEIRDLSFAYVPGVPVLHDVNLRIGRGEQTALVGPSGAGKSTLVQLLLRLYDVEPGRILVDGRDLRSFTLDSYRSRLAVVPQEVLLFNDTLRANLLLGAPDASDAVLFEALDRARLGDVVRGLPDGLDTVLGDDGVRLSGGQRQRVAICRALLRDPEILILDEATSALDRGTEQRVQESIAELLRGRTSIVIAHRAATVAGADRVVVLEAGTVVESGSPDELLARAGYLSEAWEIEPAPAPAD